MPRLALLGIACLLSALAPALSAQTVASEPAGEIINTGNDMARRMTVPVMVNGQGPFQFVIDTGADRTVISTELAERLGLPEGEKATLHAMSGSSKVRMVNIDSVQVSTNIVRDVKAAALPARNVGADGLLGVDSLQGQRVIMDFKAQTMQVVPSRKNEPADPEDEGMIVVTAKSRVGQLVMVDADANGQKVWVVVDTGAQNSVGNSKLKRLLIKRTAGMDIKAISMTDVLGRSTPAEYAIVGKMRFGGVVMSNAAIAFADVHPFRLFNLVNKPSMLLGMEGLRGFQRISVDFTNRKIKFLLNKGQ
jgi:clan AA aspartic protease (TIGR02281 family)